MAVLESCPKRNMVAYLEKTTGNAEFHESDPSPKPSPSTHIPDSIPESFQGGINGDQAKEIKHLKEQIKKLKKKAKPVITHHRAWMKSVSLKKRLAGKKYKMLNIWEGVKFVVHEEKEGNDKKLQDEEGAVHYREEKQSSFMIQLHAKEGSSTPLLHGEDLLVQDKPFLHWLVQKQMVFGKDKSIPLMVDSLPKTVCNLCGNIIGKGQICDNKCRVTFSEHDSEITKDGKVIGRGIRKKGLYVMKLGNKPKDKICLATIDENSTLWHRRLGHANMRLIQSLASKELVRNLPKLKFDQHFCDACKIRKQAHASHKAKNIVSTTRCLELLHMDLFGPSVVRSYGGNRYTLVIVDDYSRYTWTRFLKDKTEAFDQFKIFSKKIQNQLGCTIVSIRTDHGREFDNEVQFGEFCNANGITHNFSAPRTPQSNGVVERKNRTLQEMSRTMLNEQSLPQKFWCNAVDTSTYILNRILIRAILGKTPYELLRGRKPTLDYFRVFGSKCFILNTKDYLTKFDPKSYEEFKEYMFYEPDTYRHDLLENLDTLEAVIHRAVITYARLQLQSRDVQINPVQAADDSLIVSKSS
ncbi:retrovirus-related pol polyprotein from transposon TNT 1-94 [Tanacetum coccineum]